MLKLLCLCVVLFPLAGAMITGLGVRKISRDAAHWVTTLGVGISFVCSLAALFMYLSEPTPTVFIYHLYEWGNVAGVSIHIGFQIDGLSLMMMNVVTFVSLMVHIYTIGYMHDDPGYQRFFSYISLFTFAMLTLVMSDNLLQLFFGWEAVGLVSYLLIGFWFKKPTAVYANMKAFLVNRVGDLGFLLGIAGLFAVFGTLNYMEIFGKLHLLEGKMMHLGSYSVPLVTFIGIMLFIGAMGKSAQVPLHVWLPDSMEGPTPISALIHAATMVTAGIFMVSRLAPIFEMSDVARSFILVIGATTALFMGFLGLVQNDIKRIIAYSTLSQLGYMVVALGASAYAAGVFHLMTHAFFKALLFLGAGSVIIAMHHEQDIRKMGGLWRKMPITYVTMVLGSLALAGIPPFSGFYSKDVIIEAVSLATIPGATYAKWAVLMGVFVTALYSFRLLFLVFHTKPRMDHHTAEHVHESPKVVTVPLILLAIPSVLIGGIFAENLLFNSNGFFENSIHVMPAHDVLAELAHHFHGAWSFAFHAPMTLPFWIAISGIAVAYLLYEKLPAVPAWFAHRFSWIYAILVNKYGFDAFNDWFFAKGSREVGEAFWKYGDVKVIDEGMVNGSAHLVMRIGSRLRYLQSGLLNQYAFILLIGVLVLITWVSYRFF
ncbi:MAG: NADH-quinone oxidoreductase subunit L [Gammaproteobacteria bacterium]